MFFGANLFHINLFSLTLDKNSMLYWKALHIIFVVTWFAGLFYIVRLFIYHTEAQEKPEVEKSLLSNQFKIMQKRLWYGITYPSFLLTLFLGGRLLYKGWKVEIAQGIYIGYHKESWIHWKLLFVLGLVVYHLLCGKIYKNLQNDKFTLSPMQLRFWNEGATLFLFAIVFLVVLKDALGMLWGLSAVAVLTISLILGIKLYQILRKREKN
jgi:protoporphyrinogen IX oxidase